MVLSKSGRQTVTILFLKGLDAAVLVLASIIVARHWGPAFLGALTLVKVSTSIAYNISYLGFPSSIVYYGSKGDFSDRIFWRNVLATAMLLGFTSWMLYGMSVLLLRSRMFPDFTPGQILATGSIVPMMFLNNFTSSALRARQKIVLSYVTTILPELAIILPLLALLILGDSYPLGKFSAIFALVAAPQLLAFVISWVAASRIFGFPVPIIDKRVLMYFCHYGFRAYAGSITNYLNFRLDLFLLGLWTTQAQVGVYAAASRMGEVFRMISTSVAYVLKPKIVREPVGTSRMRILKYSKRLLLFGLVCGSLMFVVADPFIKYVYGGAFSEASTLLRILLAGTSFSIINGLYSSFFDGRGKPEYTSYAVLAGFGVTLVGCAMLIYPLKAVGAAITSTASYLTITFVLIRLFRSTEL